MDLQQRITGCILGTAVGDALGLPREGLGRRRAARLFGHPPLQHALLGNRGLCSDDTEHTIMVAQSLIVSQCDPQKFTNDLAKRLRWWLLRLPAGVGLATLRSIIKLWLGYNPARSGVHSAGNGPAMRSALIGLVAPTTQIMADLVRASTRITHTDPRAEQGALIIAAAARSTLDPATSREHPTALHDVLLHWATDEQLRSHMQAAFVAWKQGLTPAQFADQLGLHIGVTGFVNHTVPMAIYCWLAGNGDYRQSVESAVCLGGDSDTIGAIVGALTGAESGLENIPESWLSTLRDWPCSVAWMKQLAAAISNSPNHPASPPPSLNVFALMIRNVIFLIIILTHGFRRLLPPY